MSIYVSAKVKLYAEEIIFMNRFLPKIIGAVVLVCLFATFISCSCSKCQVETIEINNLQNWINFVNEFNKGNGSYSESLKISVNTSLDFSESSNYKLGSKDVAFNGEIDFNDNFLVYGDCFIENAEDVKIQNLHVFQREENCVYGSLVNRCSGNAEFENIVINSSIDNPSDSSILFSSSLLIRNGDCIKITGVSIFNAFISDYESIGGLVGECNKLEIYDLDMNSVTVQSLSGYLVTDAGLVARSVKELLLEDCNFERSTVLTLHYASGCVIDCEKVNINNVAYKDCYIITFPTITLPSSSSGLVWRNLSEFTQKNLSFDNVILNASDVGYITADSQSVYYKYDVLSESDKINKTDKTQ